MKWIILYRDALEKTAVSTQEMLKVHDLEATILPIQKVTDLEDEDTNCIFVDGNISIVSILFLRLYNQVITVLF